MLTVACLVLLVVSSTTVYARDYPRDEIEFCPAGGPPGWLNYFDHKRHEKAIKNYYRFRYYQQTQGWRQQRPPYQYPARSLYRQGYSRTPYRN